MNAPRPRILLVDDEAAVLDGLQLHVRRGFDALTAASGPEGLERVRQDGPFAVVLSDMRMPGMDGATFLQHVRDLAPDSTRMLLTGFADAESAIAAVNRGCVFRFLTKPCPPDTLMAALAAGAEQHRLVSDQRVLLEKTLHGAVEALANVMAMASPVAFGRAGRVRANASKTATKLGLADVWAIEVAALLSQIGCITLPHQTMERHYQGAPLRPEEQAMVARLPQVAVGLLGNIPRLEAVQEMLAGMDRRLDHAPRSPMGARILKIALDFDILEARGNSVEVAAATLRGRGGWYDGKVLEAFLEVVGGQGRRLVYELLVDDLRAGMVLAEDLRSPAGLLLVARGTGVTYGLIQRLRGFGSNIQEPIRVYLRSE